MNQTYFAVALGAFAIGIIAFIVMRALIAGGADLRFFEKNPLREYLKKIPVLAALPQSEHDFFAVHPVAEWTSTELSYINMTGAEVGHYSRSNVSLRAQFAVFGKDFEIFYPKYEIGTQLIDASGKILARIQLASIGSSDSVVKLSEGTEYFVRPHKDESVVFKADTMRWSDHTGKEFGVTYHVHGNRQSNVYVLALRKDASEMQRLCLMAFFTA